MSRKTKSREDLIAELEALDRSTEIGKLKEEITSLTTQNAALTTANKDLSNRNKALEDTLRTINAALVPFKGSLEKPGRLYRGRTYGDARDQELTEASNRASRQSQVHVQVGIKNGTHDPVTGLEYTKETRPTRDFGRGSGPIRKGELEKIFPALAGPSTEATFEGIAAAENSA